MKVFLFLILFVTGKNAHNPLEAVTKDILRSFIDEDDHCLLLQVMDELDYIKSQYQNVIYSNMNEEVKEIIGKESFCTVLIFEGNHSLALHNYSQCMWFVVVTLINMYQRWAQ